MRRPAASATDQIAYRAPFSVAAWGLIFFAGFIAVVVSGTFSVEPQAYLALVAVIALFASLLIPFAARRTVGISPRFLAVALLMFVVGALIRYLIIETVYSGVSDARGYFGAGLQLADQFRNLDFSNLVPPFTDTAAIEYFSGFLYMLLPPSQLAGFVVSAAMSFIGSWHLYKAFVTSFPNGNRRLFAILIFFLPSFWYWTTSLGKDAPVMMGLGVATYGFALMFRRLSAKGVFYAILGLLPVVIIRAPIGAAIGLAGMAAYALRPTRARSAHVQALSYIVFLPLFFFAVVGLISAAREQVGSLEGLDFQTAFQTQQEASFSGGSNFSPPNPFSPAGFPAALITAAFRPFPFEAGGLLPVLQSMEGVLLLLLFLAKRREVWRALASWRQNAMIVMAVAAFLIISIELASLANFGLLARQRTQVLPFLVMITCMVKLPRRQKVEPAEDGSAPYQAWASVTRS
ncbi:MAG: hypothetical protein WD770_06145 [Actinomycetota bacterium]